VKRPSESCGRVRARLPWFAGGELDIGTAASVRAHLVDCHACRCEAAVLQRSHAALGALATAVETPAETAMFADLHRDILAAVAAEPAPSVPTGARASWWASGRALAAAAILVVVGFWGGTVVGDRRSPGADARPLSPSASQVGSRTVVGESPRVVPYAGARVELRPLGEDRGDDEVEVGPSGLLVRRALRQLVDDGVPVPPVVPPATSVSHPR
jgi:hypothetical protein